MAKTPGNGKRTNPLTPEQWSACRRDYEDGFQVNGVAYRPGAIAPLARKHRTTRNTLKSRIRRENWVVNFDRVGDQVVQDGTPEPVLSRQQAASKVVSLLRDRTVEQMQKSGALDVLREQIGEQLATSEAIKSSVLRSFLNFAQRLERGEVAPGKDRDDSQLYESSVRAWNALASAFRVDIGRKEGEPTSPTATDTGLPQRIELVVRERPTGTDGPE